MNLYFQAFFFPKPGTLLFFFLLIQVLFRKAYILKTKIRAKAENCWPGHVPCIFSQNPAGPKGATEKRIER